MMEGWQRRDIGNLSRDGMTEAGGIGKQGESAYDGLWKVGGLLER